tara:strand:- start:150 stop:794 length:645 start_codon:yes stop_codon:yes gene_type:complete
MNEEVSIIDSKTRNERIKNFFQKNKKTLIFTIVIFIVSLISFYTFQIFKDKKKVLISNKYNTAIIEYNDLNKAQTTSDLIEVIDDQDSTYSPLALYFIIDNNLIDDRAKINELFDILINIRSLESEIKNLIIYKKGLFNADHVSESQILKILNPIINSGSVWKSHALYLVAEYFYSKNEKQKSKEFYDQILLTENANQDIRKEAQKRLNRDLSD